MIRRTIALSVAATLAAAAAPGTARAGDAVTCTLRLIHGLETPGGIDKRLAAFRKQLSKPPFSAFKTLRLVKQQELQIPRGATKKAKLPTGKILKLKFKERLLERKNKIRLRIHLSITPPKQKRFLPGTLYVISDGGTIFAGGDAFKGGRMVVGITCRSK